MVKELYETKELKKVSNSKKKETKIKLKKFSFPTKGMVIEAESYAEAVKKMQSLTPKTK